MLVGTEGPVRRKREVRRLGVAMMSGFGVQVVVDNVLPGLD